MDSSLRSTYESIVFYLPSDLAQRARAVAATRESDLSSAVRAAVCIQLASTRQPPEAAIEAGSRNAKVRIYVLPVIKRRLARAAEEAGVSRSTWVARCVADLVDTYEVQT